MSLAKALRGFQYSPQKGRFRDYLGRAVRNAVARFRARPNPAPMSLDRDDGLLDDVQGEDTTDGVWEQQWVDHHYRLALRTVRETFDRKSVEIFEKLVEGKSVASIAAEQATTEPAVHKIKQRIRARMEELITAQVREEDQLDDPQPR
jgi:DNA-directed RNA polymerase specialized sigma24 family protein